MVSQYSANETTKCVSETIIRNIRNVVAMSDNDKKIVIAKRVLAGVRSMVEQMEANIPPRSSSKSCDAT